MPAPPPKPEPGPPTEAEMARARMGRTVSLVIAGAILLWLGALWAGPRLGLPGEYAILFDLMALAALFWALVVSVGLWRKRNER
ncbi:MAG: DUF5337 domain-containing protein [Pseudomonadota bacterium]